MDKKTKNVVTVLLPLVSLLVLVATIGKYMYMYIPVKLP